MSPRATRYVLLILAVVVIISLLLSTVKY